MNIYKVTFKDGSTQQHSGWQKVMFSDGYAIFYFEEEVEKDMNIFFFKWKEKVWDTIIEAYIKESEIVKIEKVEL